MIHKNSELKNLNYEIFILLLSVLSIFNWIMWFLPLSEQSSQVIYVIDNLLSLIFISDFLIRLFTADSKKTYFINQRGWIDLLGSLPFQQLRILRTFRMVRGIKLMRELGGREVIRKLLGDGASSALYTVTFLIIVVMEFGAVSMLKVEQANPNANIKNASDALWWIFVTITTVGYGDRYPVTNLGRLVGVLVMIVGVGLFGVLTGFLANAFLKPKNAPKETDSTEINQELLNKLLTEVSDLKKQIDSNQK
jgi:voltage-gated potassium channel